MSTTSKKCLEFFKVFIREFSCERLLIPNAFVAKLNSSVPEKSILRSRSGKFWHVMVGKVGNGLFFVKGWKEFVKDNSIEDGDFLVFRYNGIDVFDFKLFGKSCCEKKEIGTHVSINKRNAFIEEEEEQRQEDVVLEEKEKEGEEAEEEDDDDEDNDDYEEEEEEAEEEDDDEDNDDYEEEEAEEERPKAVNKHKLKNNYCHRCWEEIGGNSNREYKGIGAMKDQGLCKRTAAPAIKIEAERCVQPKNPNFVTKPSPEKRNSLYAPLDVMQDHNLTLHSKKILPDPDMRTWRGKIVVGKDGRCATPNSNTKPASKRDEKGKEKASPKLV